jgi:hypothetical protein
VNADDPGSRPANPPAVPAWATAAGAVAGFLVGGSLCLAAYYGLLRLYVTTLPRRTEVDDGFGDVLVLCAAVCVSLPLSGLAGLVAGMWASARVGRFWS